MQIVENPKSDWEKEFVCSGYKNSGYNHNKPCGTVLLVNKYDLRYHPPWEGSFFMHDESICFKCPVCNCITDILKEDYPENYETLAPYSREWRLGIEKEVSETTE